MEEGLVPHQVKDGQRVEHHLRHQEALSWSWVELLLANLLLGSVYKTKGEISTAFPLVVLFMGMES